VIAALGLALAGCSGFEPRQLDSEDIVNAEGHVIGHKHTFLDERTGLESSRVDLYIPLRDPSGNLVAYEEPAAKGGSIIRDLNGRVIGTRWDDARGKGNNPGSRGVGIVYPSRDSAAGSSKPQ